MSLVNKIGLGTVQWGRAYGIANRTGRPDAAQVSAMLQRAQQSGVTLLDTAHVYGEAERLLGELHAISEGFRVFTKTVPLQVDVLTEQNVQTVRTAFFESLERLQCEHIDGLLVHSPDNLLVPGGERLWDLLQALKMEQRVSQIGVSVYHPVPLMKILDRWRIDVVQVPFNIYDQRFMQTGMLGHLKKLEVEVHARSAFLQGVLLLSPEELPGHFNSIRTHHTRLYRSLFDSNRTPLASALMFCLTQPNIDRIIVGCENLLQLQEILDVAERAADNILDLRAFALSNEDMLDPSRWLV